MNSSNPCSARAIHSIGVIYAPSRNSGSNRSTASFAAVKVITTVELGGRMSLTSSVTASSSALTAVRSAFVCPVMGTALTPSLSALPAFRAVTRCFENSTCFSVVQAGTDDLQVLSGCLLQRVISASSTAASTAWTSTETIRAFWTWVVAQAASRNRAARIGARDRLVGTLWLLQVWVYGAPRCHWRDRHGLPFHVHHPFGRFRVCAPRAQLRISRRGRDARSQKAQQAHEKADGRRWR